MKETILRVLTCILLLIFVAAIFFSVNDLSEENINSDKTELVIYGDTTSAEYLSFVEDGEVYISFDAISDFIDENIFYDESYKKVIITNEDYVYKFTVGKTVATKNLKEYDANYTCKIVEDTVYVDINLVKDIYGIKYEYDSETCTISIDKLDTDDIYLNYNNVKLYEDLDTSSEVIATLGKSDTVVVYTESLVHSRWYKVKTDTGKVGYIEKSAVTVETTNDNEDDTEETLSQDKLIMFWQYGSDIDTLGDKIEGVDVVMPTWYSISDSDGSIEINFSKEYYEKAKENGYEIWPVITNGLDNEDIDKKKVTSEIMNDEQKREDLIKNIIGLIETNNLDGINIDFEGMEENDKYLFTQFLRELYPLVKEAGATLSVDIYFTSYIDRSGVAGACDYVMLMGYDQRGTWSDKAGSISEIDWVEENIVSLIEDSNIPAEKIILGIPFYTRLWIEENGELSTKVYSMKASQEFLEKYNLSTTYDEASGQNYVEMNLDGVNYKLWIEDQTSVLSRAQIVTKYNLAGITAWQKGLETDDIWQVIKNEIKKEN